MRKFVLMLVSLFILAGTSQAQTAYEKAKLLDNTYVGVNVGYSMPLDFNLDMPWNNITGTLKLGKNFTPVFGTNAEGTVLFGDTHFADSKTFVTATYVGLNGTVNVFNLFGFKPGRKFELLTETGLGWLHIYNDELKVGDVKVGERELNDLGAKTGVVLVLNLKNGWALDFAPAVYWNLTGNADDKVQFNKSHAQFTVQLGFVYKFKTSNGTYDFKPYNITALNDQINSLRAELAKKPKEVLKEVAVEKEVVKTVETGDVVVYFTEGSAVLSDAAKANLDKVTGTVTVTGYASETGSEKVNQALSEKRAENVAAYLTNHNVTVESQSGKGKTSEPVARVVIVTRK